MPQDHAKKMLKAKEAAARLGAKQTMPIARFEEGQHVHLDNHANQEAVVLKVNFNPIAWMHSYVVSPTNSGDVIEVMEWAVSK